jgi:phage FluMu gp28-like protein
MSRVPARTPNTADFEAPAVLLPYQQRWMADKSPFKICEKSRRTGLTWAEAADDVLTAAAARSAGGQNVYYIAYNKDMTIEYVQACAMWAKAFNHAASEIEEGLWDEDEADQHVKTFTIRFPASGFRIVALTSRPSNLRGRQGTIVIDEAAFHDKLDELLKAAMAMLIWGGRVRVISTHNGVDNPFNRLIGEIRGDSDRAGTLHRLTFQEAISDGLFRRVCLRSGKPWSEQGEADWSADVYRYYGAGAAEELDCIPSQSGGAYLTRALIESRMTRDAPVVKYTCPQGFEQRADTDREAHCRQWMEEHLAPLVEALPRHVRSSLGNDFARNGDLSVFVPLIELQQLERRCPFIVEMRNVPFKQQEQILFWLCDNLPRFTHGAFDARGNGQYLAEVAMQRYGAASITQIMLTANWYLENMPKLKAAFEDGTLESMPADSDTLDDLRSIKMVNGIPRIPEQKTKTGKDQRHGDAAVALCIAWYASRQGGGPIEYIPVPLRASDAPRKDFMRPDTSSDYFKPTWDSRRDW